MSSNDRKIALISTMSPDKTWDPAVLDRVAKSHEVVKKRLTKMGFEVIDQAPLLRGYDEMAQAGRKFRFERAKALVLNVGTWTYANCAAVAAMEAGVPVLILPDAETGTCGLVGGMVANGGMKEMGIYSRLIYGPAAEEATNTAVKAFLNAACAAVGLRGQKLGLGGGRSMGMLPAVVDPNDVLKRFGVDIDCFEQVDVIERAEKVPQEKVAAFRDWMKETFGKTVAKEQAIEKQIRLYLGLLEFIKERGYDFIAMKCLPELPFIYTSFCLAHAILGDAQDNLGIKPRFVFSCEADLNAALTMQIMKNLTEGPVLFSDLTQYDFKSEVLTSCNCGSQPTDFAADKKDVHWEKEGVHEFNWKFGGCCPQHVTRPGRATIARLCRNNGRYKMVIAPVEVVSMPREKLKETIWERPHSYLKLLCNKAEFFNAFPSNHLHMIYGDFRNELKEVCQILDIEPVVVSE